MSSYDIPKPEGLPALTHSRLIDAALAMCRMRQVDHARRVSETERRTWLHHFYLELHQTMQTHIALRDQGLLDD